MVLEESEGKDMVVRLDLGYRPEAAISGDLLVATDTMAWMTFNAMRLEADGYYHPAGTAIVEFSACSLTKYGYPSDENRPEHPLYPKMEGYGIYEVLHSSWIAELGWGDSGRERHFIITFHETTFECIARDIKLEVTQDPLDVVFRRIGELVLSQE